MNFVYFDTWFSEWSYCELSRRNIYNVRSRLEEDLDDLYYTLAVL